MTKFLKYEQNKKKFTDLKMSVCSNQIKSLDIRLYET